MDRSLKRVVHGQFLRYRVNVAYWCHACGFKGETKCPNCGGWVL